MQQSFYLKPHPHAVSDVESLLKVNKHMMKAVQELMHCYATKLNGYRFLLAHLPHSLTNLHKSKPDNSHMHAQKVSSTSAC